MLERGSPAAVLIGCWGMALSLVVGAVLIGRVIRDFPYLLPNRLPSLVLYELGPALILAVAIGAAVIVTRESGPRLGTSVRRRYLAGDRVQRGAKGTMAMIAVTHFKAIFGPVTRILGSHDTTDISIAEHTTTRHEPHPGFDPNASHLHAGNTHTETHTFVNTAREFVMLLEVEGRTLKLASNDYLAVAVGDTVRAICEPNPNGQLVVLDWHNVTRGIRFRTLPSPLAGVAAQIIWSLALLAAGCGMLFGFAQAADALFPRLVAIALVVAAAILAVAAYGGADRLSQGHAELDRLTGMAA
jgi:hypothetical protein